MMTNRKVWRRLFARELVSSSRNLKHRKHWKFKRLTEPLGLLVKVQDCCLDVRSLPVWSNQRNNVHDPSFPHTYLLASNYLMCVFSQSRSIPTRLNGMSGFCPEINQLLFTLPNLRISVTRKKRIIIQSSLDFQPFFWGLLWALRAWPFYSRILIQTNGVYKAFNLWADIWQRPTSFESRNAFFSSLRFRHWDNENFHAFRRLFIMPIAERGLNVVKD